MLPKVAIVGASGLVGAELIRILLGHKGFHLEKVFSMQSEAVPVSTVYPSLASLCTLSFEPWAGSSLEGIDLLFLATPHGQTAPLVAQLKDFSGVVIDLSSDHRLRTPDLYPEAYGYTHPNPSVLSKFVYSLPEIMPDAPTHSRLISNPGCIATLALLASKPLIEDNCVAGPIIATSITGSSGAGKTPGYSTHHPFRHDNVRAYKVLSHQHEFEVAQALGTDRPGDTHRLTTLSGPFVRGIYLVSHARLTSDTISALACFERSYANSPFVRIVPHVPDLKHVVGSNFCDIHVAQKGCEVVVTAALDNLIKGAAGQAIQNANLAFGHAETEGLWTPPLYP